MQTDDDAPAEAGTTGSEEGAVKSCARGDAGVKVSTTTGTSKAPGWDKSTPFAVASPASRGAWRRLEAGLRGFLAMRRMDRDGAD